MANKPDNGVDFAEDLARELGYPPELPGTAKLGAQPECIDVSYTHTFQESEGWDGLP